MFLKLGLCRYICVWKRMGEERIESQFAAIAFKCFVYIMLIWNVNLIVSIILFLCFSIILKYFMQQLNYNKEIDKCMHTKNIKYMFVFFWAVSWDQIITINIITSFTHTRITEMHLSMCARLRPAFFWFTIYANITRKYINVRGINSLI